MRCDATRCDTTCPHVTPCPHVTTCPHVTPCPRAPSMLFCCRPPCRTASPPCHSRCPRAPRPFRAAVLVPPPRPRAPHRRLAVDASLCSAARPRVPSASPCPQRVPVPPTLRGAALHLLASPAAPFPGPFPRAPRRPPPWFGSLHAALPLLLPRSAVAR